MSKFFNDIIRVNNPGGPVRIAGFGGLEDVVTTEEQKEARTGELEAIQAGSDARWRTISVPESVLLPVQFQGSESLKSAEEAYRVLRTRLLRLCAIRELRSVIVTSSVQGEGKTLTSLNLALSCSQLQNTRVLLVDGDIRTGGLTQRLSAKSEGLADVLSGRCDPGSAVQATNHPNLFICGCGSSAHPPAELYAGDEWREFVESCTKSFDLLLIDAPPALNLSDVELMTAVCDGVLMVVRASHTRRDVLQKVSGQIDPKKLLGCVYNFSEVAHHNYYYAATKER